MSKFDVVPTHNIRINQQNAKTVYWPAGMARVLSTEEREKLPWTMLFYVCSCQNGSEATLEMN